jgi:hypothetical protein
MTQLGKVSTEKHLNLTDYLITVTRTKNGILLKGIQGTFWK